MSAIANAKKVKGILPVEYQNLLASEKFNTPKFAEDVMQYHYAETEKQTIEVKGDEIASVKYEFVSSFETEIKLIYNHSF